MGWFTKKPKEEVKKESEEKKDAPKFKLCSCGNPAEVGGMCTTCYIGVLMGLYGKEV